MAYFGSITKHSGLGVKVNITANATEVLISELNPHTNYIFQVAAVNSAGMGPFSPIFLTQTDEDGTNVDVGIVYYVIKIIM